MHFAVDRRHRDFFRQHAWIELEALFSSAKVDLLNQEIDLHLATRLGVALSKLPALSAQEQFSEGRDLWRDSAALKSTLFTKKVGQVCGELIEQKRLRLGYVQLFPMNPSLCPSANGYSALLNRSMTLNEMSSIQGVLCGLMICLKAPLEPDSLSHSSLFAAQPGHGVVFAPEWPLPLSDLLVRNGARYLMIVYVQANAVYRLQEKDFHLKDLHLEGWEKEWKMEWKKLGYHYGDRLDDQRNPLIYSL